MGVAQRGALLEWVETDVLASVLHTASPSCRVRAAGKLARPPNLNTRLYTPVALSDNGWALKL